MLETAHARQTMSGRIKQCEVYPEAFCELVCKEVLSERTMDSRDVTAEGNFLMSLECAEQVARAPASNGSRLNFLNSPHKEEERGIWAEELYSNKEFYDDIIGKGFNHALTVKARELEMKFMSVTGASTPKSQGARRRSKDAK